MNTALKLHAELNVVRQKVRNEILKSAQPLFNALPNVEKISWYQIYDKGSSDMPYRFGISPDDAHLNDLHVNDFIDDNPSLEPACLEVIDWLYDFYDNDDVLLFAFGPVGTIDMYRDRFEFGSQTIHVAV